MTAPKLPPGWKWATATARERADAIRRHAGRRFHHDELQALYMLTDDGMKAILNGDDWCPEYSTEDAMKKKFRFNAEFGDAGLVYITSPDVRGLLVADHTLAGALADVPRAMAELEWVQRYHQSADTSP